MSDPVVLGIAGGGMLVYEGRADLIQSNFSMSASSGAASAGTVVFGYEILDADSGAATSFDAPSWYFFRSSGDSYLKAIIADQSGNTLVGKWSLGFGSIYYVTDINGTVGGRQLDNSLLVVGKAMNTGAQIRQGASLSITDRISIIDERNIPVKMTLVLWKI